jgi:hypothetical protein
MALVSVRPMLDGGRNLYQIMPTNQNDPMLTCGEFDEIANRASLLPTDQFRAKARAILIDEILPSLVHRVYIRMRRADVGAGPTKKQT